MSILNGFWPSQKQQIYDDPFAYSIGNDLDRDEADYLVEHEDVHPIIYDYEGSDHSGFDRHLKYIHDETAPGKILGRLLSGEKIIMGGS